MKKRSSKILALLLCLSMLPVAGITVNAAAGTSANLVKIVEFTGQEETATVPAVTNATAKVSEIVLPGRTADDKGIEIDITAGKTTAYADLDVTVEAEKGGPPSSRTVVFDIYPNDTITKLQFRGRANCTVNKELNMSTEIPVSALKTGQWNKVMFIYNPEGYHSVYINNALYENTKYDTHFGTIATNSWRKANIRLYAYTDATEGAYLLLDNIQTAQGTAVTPVITSSKYIVADKIYEYGTGETVAGLLESITYNGTAVAVKNASGEDITENTEATVASGDSVWVYDGGICTGVYYLDAHKPLVSNFNYEFSDNDIANFANNSTNATLSEENGTNYKKHADNKVMKIAASDTDGYYSQQTVAAEDVSKISTLSFEVYPDGTWQRISVATRYSTAFASIPASKLVPNEWNRITVYIGGDKTVRPNTAYVNGKQLSHEGTTDASQVRINGTVNITNNLIRIVTDGTISENSSVVIDDYYYAEGIAIVPSVTSPKYEIEEVTINEFKNDTVADVKANITHNGSSMKIVSANGTDITNDDAAVIASGDHLYIYDGEFVIAHYRFDQAHVAPVIINSYIDSFDGITATNGSVETENGAEGKAQSDVSLKLTADTSKANATTNAGTVYFASDVLDSVNKTIPATAVSFEVYPNDTITEIVVAGRASSPGYEVKLGAVPASALVANQWNRIVFVYNTTGDNEVYLNGELYSSEDSGHFSSTVTSGVFRIKANYTKQDGVTPYVYIDEIQTAHVTDVDPRIQTDDYGIDGNLIRGCLDTVSDVKANIETSFGTSVKIKTPAGVELADDATVSAGDGIYVYDGAMILGHYYAAAGKLVVNTPVITHTGTDKGDTVDATVTYSDTAGTPDSFYIFIASYGDNGSLIDVSVKSIKTSGSDGVKTVSAETLTLTETAKEIKVMVMDTEDIAPLCDYGYV
ncbi:MAG: hypothetical protein IJB80_06435 [Clostridia bacterium]|nr:hypothetical protein [Clostridia bacterium]